MARARIEDGWVRCAKCGHKLGKMVGVWNDKFYMPALEIKCHSCKEINHVMIGGQGSDRTR